MGEGIFLSVTLMWGSRVRRGPKAWQMLPLWLWSALGGVPLRWEHLRGPSLRRAGNTLLNSPCFSKAGASLSVGLSGPHPTCDFELSPTCGTHFFQCWAIFGRFVQHQCSKTGRLDQNISLYKFSVKSKNSFWQHFNTHFSFPL